MFIRNWRVFLIDIWFTRHWTHKWFCLPAIVSFYLIDANNCSLYKRRIVCDVISYRLSNNIEEMSVITLIDHTSINRRSSSSIASVIRSWLLRWFNSNRELVMFESSEERGRPYITSSIFRPFKPPPRHLPSSNCQPPPPDDDVIKNWQHQSAITAQQLFSCNAQYYSAVTVLNLKYYNYYEL